MNENEIDKEKFIKYFNDIINEFEQDEFQIFSISEIYEIFFCRNSKNSNYIAVMIAWNKKRCKYQNGLMHIIFSS